MTITLDGVADDGEAGEGDNVGADVEGATGGAGQRQDRRQRPRRPPPAAAGNDTIIGGTAEDRLEGNEGDDTIDSRDGRYDSIDCGPGNDTLLADPGDGAENCEIAPDRDGDGTLNEADCAPDNAAIHPGAGEIVGNAVDEDCKGGPLYLRMIAPGQLQHAGRTSQSERTFDTLACRELKAGDKVEIRCTAARASAARSRKKTVTATRPASARSTSPSCSRSAISSATRWSRCACTRANEIGRVHAAHGRNGAAQSRASCCASNVGGDEARREVRARSRSAPPSARRPRRRC